MDGTRVVGTNGDVWADLRPGESLRLGRGEGVEVDVVVSNSRYVSAHACTILASTQTCWVENWSSAALLTVVDDASPSSRFTVAPHARALNPFLKARVQIPSGVEGHVEFIVEPQFLREAVLLPGGAHGQTRSLPDEIRACIRAEQSAKRGDGVRQWYSCLALCEPFVRQSGAVETPTMAEIATRLAPLTDVDTGVSVEEKLGVRATASAIGKRIRKVREHLARMESDEDWSDQTGNGTNEAARLLAERLVRSGAVTVEILDHFLPDRSSNRPDEHDDDDGSDS